MDDYDLAPLEANLIPYQIWKHGKENTEKPKFCIPFNFLFHIFFITKIIDYNNVKKAWNRLEEKFEESKGKEGSSKNNFSPHKFK